jgi:hypothetical protein
MDNWVAEQLAEHLDVIRKMSLAKAALALGEARRVIERGINDNMRQAYGMRGEAINIDIESWKWETPARGLKKGMRNRIPMANRKEKTTYCPHRWKNLTRKVGKRWVEPMSRFRTEAAR